MTYPSDSTAAKVLAALERFDLKRQAQNFFRLNSPYRAGSNSHGFVLILSDDLGERGGWYDHVTQEKGSLYQLAEHLGIPTPRKQVEDTKRAYADLADYARAHGIDATTLSEAGWRETTHNGRPALAFKTANGERYRFLDGDKPHYINQPGYRPCWYGLRRAVQLAGGMGAGQPLVVCNGEISTVVAQAHGIPACAITGGERTIPDALLAELKASWRGRVLVALDCDETGRRVAQGMVAQIPDAYAVDLQLGKGGDLADFCRLYKGEAHAALLKLVPLANPNAFDSGDMLDMRAVAREAALQAREWGLDPRPVRGIPSGIAPLDAMLSGFLPDDIVIVLGKSGSGKSLIALQMLQSFAKHGPGLLFSTEMSPVAYMHRLVSQQFSLNARDIYTGRAYTQALFDRYAEITQSWQVMACKRTDPSPKDILDQAEKALGIGAKWCIIDSLNNVKLPGATSIYEELRETMRVARVLAHDMKMLVVMTMQAGNAPNERAHKEPRPSDGYGGQIAYHDATRFLCLWRPGYDVEAGLSEGKEAIDPSKATLRIAKDRHFGTQGALIPLRWTGTHYVSAAGEGHGEG